MEKGSFWLPPQRSTLAPDIDVLFYWVLWTSIILWIGVAGSIIYFAWKYRRRRKGQSVLVESSHLLEWSWIIVPTLLVVVTFIWGFRTYIKAVVPPGNAYTVYVKAAKWLWEYEYPNAPNGMKVASELVVPVGRPVKLVMTSQDVIHSYFVPAFRVKQDVIPNRYTTLWFEATEQGTYQVYCTEYCGTQHSGMLSLVRVLGQDEFNAWVRDTGGKQEGVSYEDWGRQVYQQKQCINCHSVDGSPAAGPTFQGLFGNTRTFTDGSSVVADEEYIRESLLAPGEKIVAGFPPVMPVISLQDDDVRGIIEFIKSLE